MKEIKTTLNLRLISNVIIILYLLTVMLFVYKMYSGVHFVSKITTTFVEMCVYLDEFVD